MTTITQLQERCGTAAAMKGFHDDRPRPMRIGSSVTAQKEQQEALTNWRGNKLMLIVSEAVEAHDELRKGHPADFTYYSDGQGLHNEAVSDHGDLRKPEGAPSELADVVIRVLDFCYTEGIDLETIIEEKLLFNASRPYKHGKKF